MSAALRVGLFSGLVLHKLVWSALERRDGRPAPASRPARRPLRLRALKAAKVGALAGLLLQALFLDILPISRRGRRPVLTTIGVLLYLLGLGTAIGGRLQLGENWANIEDRGVLPEHELVAHGIYRYVRHPIYAGDVLLIVGLELALGSWLVLLGLPLLAIVARQAGAEERLLADTLPGYDAYRRRSRRFIPCIW